VASLEIVAIVVKRAISNIINSMQQRISLI